MESRLTSSFEVFLFVCFTLSHKQMAMIGTVVGKCRGGAD